MSDRLSDISGISNLRIITLEYCSLVNDICSILCCFQGSKNDERYEILLTVATEMKFFNEIERPKLTLSVADKLWLHQRKWNIGLIDRSKIWIIRNVLVQSAIYNLLTSFKLNKFRTISFQILLFAQYFIL